MGGAAEDGYTNALNTITYEHHEIHAGSHFYIRDVIDQAINTVFDLQITVPNTRKWAHMVWALQAEAEVDLYIYEGVRIINAGTAIVPVNSNRNSTKTASLVVKSQVNASVGDANADTAVAAATEIEHQKAGDGVQPGTSQRNHELILKQNTDYAFRCVFTKAAYISFDLRWYEHTNKIFDTTQGGI